MTVADGTRWGLALLLACPACAGGFLLALGAAVGVTAAVLRGTLLAAVLVLLAALWLRGHLMRRADACDACPE